ncbi:MAG: hypothetical protein IID41_13010 [Planctomycetes bacterium]|nr:hypothetical protein [Planctomycetota bacterium]
MAQNKPSIYELIGNSMQGDLAGMTCYTSKRNKVVWFVKSPPLKPASPNQRTIRNIFVLNANVWRAFSEDERTTWSAAARRARLRLSGYNLFTWWMRIRDDATLRTIERQSGISIHKPDTSP